MELSLPSVWTYLATFIVFTAIFHLWLVYIMPLADIAWRRVDYIWLGLSIAAIAVAASQWRSRVASDMLTASEAAWHIQTVDGLLEPVKAMRTVMCEKSQSSDTAGCNWFKSVIAQMENAGETTPGWLVIAPPMTDKLRPDFQQEAEIIITRIQELRTEALKRRTLELIAANDNGHFALIVPLYFLPVALALRITKVSGEIRIARQKERLSRSAGES